MRTTTQRLIRKEAKKVSRERTRVADESFVELHTALGAELRERTEQTAKLRRQLQNERDAMASLGALLDPREAGRTVGTESAVDRLSDPPFLAKTCIFARLCDSLVRSLVGQLGRLGRNHLKVAELSESSALRLEMYVRNVLYGDVAMLAEDAAGRRSNCEAVAHSQLGQDLALSSQLDEHQLREQRGQDMHLLFTLASQLLNVRFEAERDLERVADTLQSLASSCEASLRQEGTLPDYLIVEQTQLLEQLSIQISSLRSRLERTQQLVDTLRAATGSFVVAVLTGQPFKLTPASLEEPIIVSSNSICNYENPPPSEALDLDVAFWLQWHGHAKLTEQFRGVAWPQLTQLGDRELRQLRLQLSESARMKLIQQLLALNASDWVPVMCSGWMRKRGEGSLAAWRRRYFVLLRSRELLYFKSDVGTRPQGSFFLSKVIEVQEPRPGLISLVTRARVYELEPEPSELAQWLSFFNTFRAS